MPPRRGAGKLKSPPPGKSRGDYYHGMQNNYDKVYIIEANPRASRTVPFISKAYKEPYVNYATKVMLGKNKIKDFNFKPTYEGYAIKEPVFSFSKFPNVNKKLGPEMKSTGESILFIDNLQDDKFYELYSRRKMYLSK